MKRTLSIGVSILAISATSVVAQNYDPGATDETIRIGVIVPLSGNASAYGSVGSCFEGYFEMRDFGRDAKRFSGRVAVDRGPNGELIQTAHLRTFRESGLDGSTDSSIPRLFSKGFQDSISLVSEPGFLSGRLDDMYITLAKP